MNSVACSQVLDALRAPPFSKSMMIQSHTRHHQDIYHTHYKNYLKKGYRLQEQLILMPLGVDETTE